MKPFPVLSPLHKASRQVQIFMTARCRPFGVSTVEAHLLGYCATKASCPISELQRVLGEKKSTLTAILDRLESRSLVARRFNARDRRSRMIEVTRGGSALADKLRKEYRAFESRLRKRIRQRDLEGFEAVMKAIGDATNVSLTRAARPGEED